PPALSAQAAPSSATSAPHCGVCTGTPGVALATAIRETATKARRCYIDALTEDPTLEGKLTPYLRVDATGAVCDVSLAAVDPTVASLGPCVQRAFEGASYPPPDRGCVVVSLTLAFTLKK
ncbi:MAG: AgmX/PglI C-terminal domain-containing protein, partial [Myxococcaceae bacterium]